MEFQATHTDRGHEIIELPCVPAYRHLITTKDWPLTYLRGEYEQQIVRLEALGICTNSQMFEQCINQVLFLLERQRGQFVYPPPCNTPEIKKAGQ